MPKRFSLTGANRVLFPILFLCGAFAMVSFGSAKVPTAALSLEGLQRDCAATTDAELVAAVQAKIKADKRFTNQWKHINVSSSNRVVTISGWVNGKVQLNDLLKFARTTKCVKKVVSKAGSHLMVGCSAGQKACGDICIDKSEQCNLMQQTPE